MGETPAQREIGDFARRAMRRADQRAGRVTKNSFAAAPEGLIGGGLVMVVTLMAMWLRVGPDTMSVALVVFTAAFAVLALFRADESATAACPTA
jgi:hypothetical protein